MNILNRPRENDDTAILFILGETEIALIRELLPTRFHPSINHQLDNARENHSWAAEHDTDEKLYDIFFDLADIATIRRILHCTDYYTFQNREMPSHIGNNTRINILEYISERVGEI